MISKRYFGLIFLYLVLCSCLGWATDHPRLYVAASSCAEGCESGSGPNYAIDDKFRTAWSSQYRDTEWLPQESPEWFALWFDTVRYTDYVRLVPGTYNGSNQCVPYSIEIYYLDIASPVWKFWDSVDLIAGIPQAGYTIALPYGIQTNGILLRTFHLRADEHGGYYFQIAEVYPGRIECPP